MPAKDHKAYHKKRYHGEYREKARERSREYHRKNPEKHRARSKAYNEAHKEERKVYRREYYLKNREKIRAQQKEKRVPGRLKNLYGLSVEEYDGILIMQDWHCALCPKKPEPGKMLAVDHCHESGVIRGLLCFRCNIRVGYLQKRVDEAGIGGVVKDFDYIGTVS